MNKIIILHSFGRTSQDNWYHSVATELGAKFQVITPNLPHTELGRADEWLAALKNLKPDQSTILIGHSLGGTLILRYLEQEGAEIAGIVLVAAPVNDLARNDLHVTGFFERDFAWPIIEKRAGKRLILASTDDPTVPFWQAEYMAKNLAGQLIKFNDKGHFNQRKFPELVRTLRNHFLTKELNGREK